MTGVGSSPALAICETSQVLLAGVSGVFSRGTPVSPHLPIGWSRYECKNLKRDVKLYPKKISWNAAGGDNVGVTMIHYFSYLKLLLNVD